ncbi:MAG TPA: M56 family metallopeptidase, partial [Planctomycetaceae bacterium]|nr:M56 family metallopeptidase [Planctomycetaceae bacterium]
MNTLTLVDPLLGWQITLTLLHVSWIALALALLAAIGNRLLAQSSAHRRYGLSFAALLAIGVSLPLTFAITRLTTGGASPLPLATTQPIPDNNNVAEATRAAADTLPPELLPALPATASLVTPEQAAGPVVPSQASPTLDMWAGVRTFSPYIAELYLLGVVAMLAKLLLAVYGGQRLRAACRPVADSRLLAIVAQQSQRLALRFVPAVHACERVVVPVVLGVFRPMILLPGSMLSGLTPEQLAAVLTHELAHIRRYDHVWILIQRLIEAALFFHPAVWYLSRCVHHERESCCDDLVVAAGGDPLGYAQSLLRVAELRLRQEARANPAARSAGAELVAVQADGGNPSRLRHRIARLLGVADEPAVRLNRSGVIAGAALILMTAGLCCSSLFSQADDAADEGAKTFLAELPDGTTVELLGVAFHPADDRPWWKPDGASLASPPFEKTTDRAVVYDRAPEQADCREFAIRILGLPGDNTARMLFVPSVTWAGGPSGKPGELKIASAAGPFKDRKTATVGVALTNGDWGPPKAVTLSGLFPKAKAIPPEFRDFYDLIQPQKVASQGDETSLFLTMAPDVYERAAFELMAVDLDGKRHRAPSQAGRDNVTEFIFRLPRARIDHFEFRLRPYLRRVMFDNVSLNPGGKSAVKIRVESPSLQDAEALADRFISALRKQALSFVSEAHLAALRKEFLDELGRQLKAPLSKTRREALLAGIDRFTAATFSAELNRHDNDNLYVTFRDRLDTLKWELRVAATRSELDQEQIARRDEQRNWLRDFVRNLPPAPTLNPSFA